MCMVWRKKCWECNELFSRSAVVQYIYVPILLYQYDLAGVLYSVYCMWSFNAKDCLWYGIYIYTFRGPRFRATCKDCKCSKNCLQIGAPLQLSYWVPQHPLDVLNEDVFCEAYTHKKEPILKMTLAGPKKIDMDLQLWMFDLLRLMCDMMVDFFFIWFQP